MESKFIVILAILSFSFGIQGHLPFRSCKINYDSLEKLLINSSIYNNLRTYNVDIDIIDAHSGTIPSDQVYVYF